MSSHNNADEQRGQTIASYLSQLHPVSRVLVAAPLSAIAGVFATIIALNAIGQYLHLWINLGYVMIWVAAVTIVLLIGHLVKRVTLVVSIFVILAVCGQGFQEWMSDNQIMILANWASYVFILLALLLPGFFFRKLVTDKAAVNKQ